MSVRAIAEVWENGPDNAPELLIMLALADHANDDGVCWPTVGRLAHKARMSERNARRTISKLIDDGWITVDRRGGAGRASVYVLNLDGFSRPGVKGDKLSPLEKRRTNPAKKADTAMSEKADTAMSPQPSRTIIEPSGDARRPFALTPSPSVPDVKKRELKRLQQIGDWAPDEIAVLNAAATIYGTTSPEAVTKAQNVVQMFVDHAKDRGRVSKDWNAAFRNWVMKEAQFEEHRISRK